MFGLHPLVPLVLLSALGGSSAFWRMQCSTIQIGRIDPIVTPGRVSGHVHTIAGASNLGINSTFDSLYQSQCTSCEIQDDRSAYWTPKLYYQFANGSFVDVPNQGAVIYYLGRGVQKNNITAFPPGFRMLSGNVGARHYDNSTLTYGAPGYPNRPSADRISFACLSTAPQREQHYMFSTDCVNGLRAQLHMQSCWDGVNLYKTDNSHVAYMSQIDDGVCPPTHPIQFVHIFIETLYSVNNVKKEAGGRFVWSTGDTTGYGFHGDFQNGWEPDVIQGAVDVCASAANSSGDIAACPILQKSRIDNYAYQCPRRPDQVDEKTTGLLAKLPGCINVTTGPQDAVASDMVCPTTVKPPYVTPTVDSYRLVTQVPTVGSPFGNDGWDYVGCTNDSSPTRVLSATSTSNQTSMTVTKCQSFCSTKGYKYAGLEFGAECFCDNYISDTANPDFTVGKCYYACTGDRTVNCGGIARMDVYVNRDVVAPPKPSYVKQVGKYVHKGCYKEKTGGGRALANASTAADTMTVDVCAKFCLGKRLKWMGVEYGRECYCGTSLINSTATNITDCTTRCAGNSGKTQQYCGGPSKLNVFYSSTL